MRQKRKKFNANAYKSNVIFFGILISAATLFFQNCGKIKNSSSAQYQKSLSIGKVSTENSVQVLDTTSEGSEYGPRIYTISKTGQVTAGYFENPDSKTTLCALSDEKNQELQNYLENEFICFYESTATHGDMCSSVYTYPYFITISDSIKYELGKKTSSCSETFDICGSNRLVFKSFIDTIVTELNQSCSNK